MNATEKEADMNKDECLRRLRRTFLKGIKTYDLLSEGDKVLIGLSGGKDSLALTQLLGERSRIYAPRFSVVAVHVVMENIPYRSDHDYLRRFAESHGVQFELRTTRFDASTDRRKSPCFLCSWNRRKVLFDLAKELGCNKIALGHHMDDILQTLLMNMTFQGSFSTMPPKLKMQKFDMTLIRPLCLCREADIKALAAAEGYKQLPKNCPHEQTSHRSDMKAILQQLETMSPEARYSLWKSMTHIQTDFLPQAGAE